MIEFLPYVPVLYEYFWSLSIDDHEVLYLQDYIWELAKTQRSRALRRKTLKINDCAYAPVESFTFLAS